ncbi:MAG: homoserine O-succinyltransferase [Candidatus Methylumidiphilus sp.]
MPLVAHSNLPAFDDLKREGETVIPADLAIHQDIRELHIGLLNLMPDAALTATERQFLRLINDSNQIAQFYVHLFTLPELERGTEGLAHVQAHYETFAQIKASGLDALIVTGANVTQPDLAKEAFWNPLVEVVDWAYEHVTSTLFSCLTTHAVLQFRFGQKRRPLPAKRWGVFPHHLVERQHPLVVGVNTRFDVPHSRFNEISRDQFEEAGLRVLVEGEGAGVHLAVSRDGFRLVFFQGHPEYDTISLLKEYKREVTRFACGAREDYPPFPESYFSPLAQAILDEYAELVRIAKSQGESMPRFPEDLIAPKLDNTWHDTAEAILNNWVGKVYQTTNQDRARPFMEGVNPDDPLGIYG